jgi:hypothetical protein
VVVVDIEQGGELCFLVGHSQVEEAQRTQHPCRPAARTHATYSEITAAASTSVGRCDCMSRCHNCQQRLWLFLSELLDAHVSCCADCNGQVSTATGTLRYVIPVTVNADSYSYSASPFTVTAATGLLANDVNPASCVAQGKALTAVGTSASASGTVVVSAQSSLLCRGCLQAHT